MVKKTKGFLRDPLFYLGSLAAILLIFAAFSSKTAENNFVASSSSQLAGTENKVNTFVQSVNSQPESPELYLVQKNTILGFAPPMTVTQQVLGMIMGEVGTETNKDITEYEVLAGDTLSSIAEKFGVSLDTLLWANDLSSKSKIKVGQKLVILPVSGILHHVKSGDTISSLSQKYKADAQEVVEFNELISENDIFVGDILIVPNGTMSVALASVSTPTQVPVGSSYFICPIASPCRITQGLHYYNAIDFSHGKCGDSILAAAGGTVQRVKFGWNGGAGNTITILHPNGVVTSYGHILTALVGPGDKVYQGQKIALMGGDTATQGVGAGISTGCHVHFAVLGANNPFSK